MVDDYSNATWVSLMNIKSESTIHLHNFFAMVECQFQDKIKQVRSDNAQEFFTKDFSIFFEPTRSNSST